MPKVDGIELGGLMKTARNDPLSDFDLQIMEDAFRRSPPTLSPKKCCLDSDHSCHASLRATLFEAEGTRSSRLSSAQSWAAPHGYLLSLLRDGAWNTSYAVDKIGNTDVWSAPPVTWTCWSWSTYTSTSLRTPNSGK